MTLPAFVQGPANLLTVQPFYDNCHALSWAIIKGIRRCIYKTYNTPPGPFLQVPLCRVTHLKLPSSPTPEFSHFLFIRISVTSVTIGCAIATSTFCPSRCSLPNAEHSHLDSIHSEHRDPNKHGYVYDIEILLLLTHTNTYNPLALGNPPRGIPTSNLPSL